MSKFALNNKDIDSIKGNTAKRSFELFKTDKDEFTLLEHVGNHVGELVSLSKREWRAIWQMLTERE